MDYEKKYKEALERMKSWANGEHPECFSEAQKTAEFIFPELKESEDKDEIIRQCLIEHIKCNKDLNWSLFQWFKPDTIIAWLEKQGEQMTKPKFKVGDWITDGSLTCKVLGVTDKSYELHPHNDDYCHFETDIQSVDKYYRLWTIQDAKDGDVLVAKDGHPFIFTGEFDAQDDNPTAYCGINSSDKFIIGKGSHWTFKDGIKPATKEQRDLLFENMKEAGYEWDAEKKEVKKIEVASKESKDERMKEQLSEFLHDNMRYQDAQEITSWLEKLIEKQGELKECDEEWEVTTGLYKCTKRMFDGTPESRLWFEIDNLYKCISKNDVAEFESSYGHTVFLTDPVVRKHFIKVKD